MIKLFLQLQAMLNKTRVVDFLAPLAIRYYLAPIFWMAGTEKLAHMQDTIAWFANADWGLGLPFPTVMAYLATFTELVGAVCLALGIAVRWLALPLMVTMIVAALTVHIDNGWLVIADHQSEAMQRLSAFLNWLQAEFPKRHGFITELGVPIMLNNGIEFAATYFVMLLTLFFYGAGKYCSLDYWCHAYFARRT